DFDGGAGSERMAQQRIEALAMRRVALDIGDDRFRRHLFPLRDHTDMECGQIGEVPIEAAARDAELARQHIRLERIAAFAREREEAEIDPVLGGQAPSHDAAPYRTVLTAASGGD